MSIAAEKSALVTGATGAIGRAIARELAMRNHQVVIVARDPVRAERTVDRIRQETGNPAVHYELADLSRKHAVVALSKRWQGALHLLINVAAVTPPRRQETPEGIECQFATNVLGYFWMMQFFAEHLMASAPARVVNVASYWAGDLDPTDLEFKRRSYRNGVAYRQSKQANRMLTVAFAERWRATGVTVNACHPGDVNSTLSNNLGFGGHETPAQGADTPVWLATNPELSQQTGAYFEQRRAVTCRFSQDLPAIKALYQVCLAY